jgi:hypothetical protein
MSIDGFDCEEYLEKRRKTNKLWEKLTSWHRNKFKDKVIFYSTPCNYDANIYKINKHET